MTGTEVPEHPEIRGAGLISPAVQSILIDQFRDELRFGSPEYTDGTHPAFQGEKESTMKDLLAKVKTGDATFVDFLLMHAFEVAAETDPARLRMVLTSLGATVVQWIESLDSRYGGK